MSTGLAVRDEGALARAEWAGAELRLLLQLACSGELGAARAYAGHRASLRDPKERAELGRILRDELVHRRCLRGMLRGLGSVPDPRRERRLDRVGRLIAASCFFGGWFIPMYGAGKLESQNVREYEHAARLALCAGHAELVDELLGMAEVEWDHERYFRETAQRHFLWRFLPRWPVPPPRAAIRDGYARFAASNDRAVEPVRVPWLLR